VFDPIRDEAYFAVRGAGAWLGAKPLQVPGAAPELADALAEVSLRRDTKSLRGAVKRHPPYRKRITSGASTLSWCHLAAGRIDMSTRLTLCCTAAESGTTKPRIEPDRLKEAAMLPSRMSAISRYGVMRM